MQFIQEFFGLFRDTPAQDDQIRPEQCVVFIDDRIQFARPSFPAQAGLDFRPARRALLGFASCDLQMTEFGIGDQSPIDEKRAADAGPQRQQQYGARYIAGRAVMKLRKSRRIRVVDRRDGPMQLFGGEIGERLADPCLVEVGCGLDDAVANDAGKSQAH